MRWLLSYTGEDSLDEIVLNIRKLEQLEHQSQGNLQSYTQNILNSYYQLASDTARYQGNFALAWKYANDALRVTKRIGLNDFISAAFYRRGYTLLEWGVFGDQVSQGLINSEPERKKIESAIVDFEAALPHAQPQLKGAIWLELSRAQGILQQSSLAIHLFQQAETMVGAETTASSPVEQILLEGALNGLNEGMYLLGKTASLIVLGRTTTAIEVLDELDELKNGKRIPRNQTRRLAYTNVLRAEASFGVKDYMTASLRALEALKTFQDINTIERIAGINDLYRRLTERYGKQPEVKELGKMLSKYYKRNTPHEKS